MNKYMAIAIDEARKGIHSNHGGPFGSVIVKDGQIIGTGHNEVLKNQDATCHGEIVAIRNASKALHSFDLKDCELYTTAEPCPMCLFAIKWANISKVYFGCNREDTANIGFRDDDFYNLIKSSELEKGFISELDRDECLKLFDEYKKLDAKKY